MDVGFPRLIGEAQPEPRTLSVSGGLLLRPHVFQRHACGIAEFAGLRVIARKNQRVENRFGAARLDGLVRAAIPARRHAPRALIRCTVAVMGTFSLYAKVETGSRPRTRRRKFQPTQREEVTTNTDRRS